MHVGGGNIFPRRRPSIVFSAWQHNLLCNRMGYCTALPSHKLSLPRLKTWHTPQSFAAACCEGKATSMESIPELETLESNSSRLLRRWLLCPMAKSMESIPELKKNWSRTRRDSAVHRI